MKKLWILLLCLMLVLPLHVYAEDTESQAPVQVAEQPLAQSESQPSQPAESQPPQSTETQPPQPAESQPPQTTETQPPQQTETQPSQPAESQPSEHTHVWDVSYTVPATCQEEGATAYGCSACGAISVEVLPKAGHKFSTQWTKNASGHWHACSACGEQGDFGKHYPGPAATEEKAQICLTCGYTLTAKLGHTHKYENQWTSDETGHWYACSGCDERKDFADHSYDAGCDPDCNVCGYQTSAAHVYSGTWHSDEKGHWDICTICQEASDLEPHIPGPEVTDTENQLCLACGFVLTSALESEEHVHKADGNWQTDTENHWKTCDCGETVDAAAHIWDDGEDQEDGTTLYTCKDCGFTRTEEVSEAGVSPLVWISVTLAVLLSAAVALLLLLISRLKKSGKYGK